ncbi:MAG: nucleotide exchange factor GrpE [Blastocatellia bacterium]
MNSENEMEDLYDPSLEMKGDDPVSVDDFIKQLEEKEKDLHITADTSIIEIAESFDDTNLPDFLVDAVEKAAAEKVVETAPAGDDAIRLKLEIEQLKGEVRRLSTEREEMVEVSHRRAKDFEAFRKRVERERRETFHSQISNLAMLMLPALDNLHRALAAAENLPGGKSPAFQHFFDGIVLVSEQINDILNKMGIKPICAIGEEFDPHFHEAVATEETSKFPPNTVCGELLRGYIAGERVLRHSLVKVARPPKDAKSAEILQSNAEPRSDIADP